MIIDFDIFTEKLDAYRNLLIIMLTYSNKRTKGLTFTLDNHLTTVLFN